MIYQQSFLAFILIIIMISQFQGLAASAVGTPFTTTSDSHTHSHLSKRSTWRHWSWSSSGPAQDPTSHYSTDPASSSHPTDAYLPHSKPAPTYGGPKTGQTNSDIKRWLDQHNKFRAQYSAPPLKWSEELAVASKRLTDTCVWRHTQNNKYGENMSAGQRSIEEVVSGWVTGPHEKSSYNGDYTEPSHFTQVVWEATTEVGCYKSVCDKVRGANLPQSPVTFWACNYNPPGNVIGEVTKNVKAAPGGRPL